MTRGESTRDKTRWEILSFLFHGENSQHFKDIEHSCSGSRNTIKKYLEELKDEGVVEQSDKGRHPYSLTEKGKEYAERERARREFVDEINRLSKEEIRENLRLMRKLIRILQDERKLLQFEKLLRDESH